MAKKNGELSQWTDFVQGRSLEQLPSINVPLHVLFGEAADVAKFFEKHWKNQVDDKGKVIRLGLESAVPKGARKARAGRLHARTGSEILSLQRATQVAQTCYLLAADHRSERPMARGQFLVGEIAAVLAWCFDDGIEDDKDEMLARVEAAHEGDPQTGDALAGALEDYAALADRYRKDLDGLGGFSAAHIDEAIALASELRGRPVHTATLSDEARQALDLRNKLAGLLLERMNLVRAAARFVFRGKPQIIRDATSAYERRRRAAARRAKPAAQPAPAVS
jgi:hypothetical protein